jgi:hypothetical protein
MMWHSYDLPVELVLLTYESLADELVVPRDRRGPPLKRNTSHGKEDLSRVIRPYIAACKKGRTKIKENIRLMLID